MKKSLFIWSDILLSAPFHGYEPDTTTQKATDDPNPEPRGNSELTITVADLNPTMEMWMNKKVEIPVEMPIMASGNSCSFTRDAIHCIISTEQNLINKGSTTNSSNNYKIASIL